MANTGGDIYPHPQTAPDPLATAEVLKAGKFSGLKGRWLAHAVDDQDAGYTLSLWENEAAMRNPAKDDPAAPETFLLGSITYNALWVRLLTGSLALFQVCVPTKVPPPQAKGRLEA